MTRARDRRELRQLLGVQLQESQLQDKLTVAEAMRLYASFYRRPADIDGLLAMLDLTEKRNTRYRKLSGGQKQRLSIALALIGRPRIAILDELTTGLDPVARRDAWRLIDDIRNSGVTIMLITHFMTEAERLCDRVAIMRDGRIVALGTPAALGRPTLEDTFVGADRPESHDEDAQDAHAHRGEAAAARAARVLLGGGVPDGAAGGHGAVRVEASTGCRWWPSTSRS